MKKQFLKIVGLFMLIFVLAACQSTEETESGNAGEQDAAETNGTEEHEHAENEETDHEAPEEVLIEGMADHYHTGDAVELTAVLENGTEGDHWHWYSREGSDVEWEVVSGQETETFSGKATNDGTEIKAVLFGDDHDPEVQSVPVTIAIDDHHGGSDDVSKRISEGFFYYDEVGDRELSDFAGDWQSVYPYLTNGELEEVMEDKAENNDEMTKEDYIEYYEAAYETDVDRVVITDDSFTFHYEDGREETAEYASEGYEILERDTGNRQVRFVYKRQDDTEAMPTYMIFSDHNINAAPAYHFHLYFGEDREALLAERSHFPTYYPSDLDADGIIREMLAH